MNIPWKKLLKKAGAWLWRQAKAEAVKEVAKRAEKARP